MVIDQIVSQENTSGERSSGVNDVAKAPLSCAASVSGVQPSARCSVRIGLFCEQIDFIVARRQDLTGEERLVSLSRIDDETGARFRVGL
jgi:hypothetical protein